MFRIEFSCVFRKPRREVLCLTAIVRPRFQRTSPASERLAGRRSGRLGRPTIRRHRGRPDRRGSAGGTPARPWSERKGGVEGKRGSVSGDLGGRRSNKKKNKIKRTRNR